MSSNTVNSCASRIGFLDLLLCKTCFKENDSDRDCLIPIEEAINLTTAAIEEDKKGNLNEVLRLLTAAQEHFKLSKKPQSARVRKAMNAKKAVYQEKLNAIKDYMINRKKNIQASTGDATSLGNVTDSNAEDETLKKVKDAIVIEKPNIRWSDVAGLDEAKESLKETAILPISFPSLFTGKRKPSNGILLFGPPGTGKTFLAKAVATEANKCTFFSISPTHLVCMWLGESERVMKNLFDVARQQKPSIIFIDYIDSLCNSDSDKESESVRRMKTEFLLQMQGIGSNTDGILVLGATNKPWTLDEDVLRSFTKKIYIPLPDETARLHILKKNIGDTPNSLTEDNFKQLAEQTVGFSGADISALVQDALMQPIRKLQKATHFLRVSGPSRAHPNITVDDLLTPNSPATQGAEEISKLGVPVQVLLEPVVPTVSGTSRAHPNTMMDDLLTPSSPETHGAEEMSKLEEHGEILLKPVVSTHSNPQRAYPHISVYDLLTQWKEEETRGAEEMSEMDVPSETFLEPVISQVNGPSRAGPDIMVDDLFTPCSPETHGAKEMSWMDVPGEKLLEPPISMHDMLCSLGNLKPSVNDTYLEKLKKFAEDFGQ